MIVVVCHHHEDYSLQNLCITERKSENSDLSRGAYFSASIVSKKKDSNIKAVNTAAKITLTFDSTNKNLGDNTKQNNTSALDNNS